ncbi:carbohydrate esterase family 4 protein [Mycena capillaripes]|nr:carbohydrate esterase family 4 protein [Mycena capillaripes]
MFKTFLFLLFPILSLAQRSIEASAPKAVVYSGCTIPNTVALTFDDGPYIYGDIISQTLTSKGAKGTFFVNGYNYNCIYSRKVAARLQDVYNSGHQICSHTWSHPDLTKLNATQIAAELEKIDTALFKILGIKTNFVRPPYGSYNNLARQVASQMNKSFILWDFDSGDSVGATLQQSEAAYKQAMGNITIALNHETEKTTAMSLVEFAIDKFQEAGYKLVTAAECLGLDPYTFIGPPQQRDDTWFCPEKDDD